MASKPLSEYTVEELQTSLKRATSAGTTLVSIYSILFVIMIAYAWMSNWEFDMKIPIIVMVLGVTTTVLPMLASRGKFSKELERRNGDANIQSE